MNAYEFIIQMKNYASSSLQSVAASVGMTNTRVNELNGNFQGTERSASSFSSTAGAGFTKLIGLAAALGISIGVVGGLKALFNMGVQMEQTNVKFEVLLGSVDKDKYASAVSTLFCICDSFLFLRIRCHLIYKTQFECFF
jgi:hypothetical protein